MEIFFIVVAVIVIAVAKFTIKIVPQQNAWIVELFSHFSRDVLIC